MRDYFSGSSTAVVLVLVLTGLVVSAGLVVGLQEQPTDDDDDDDELTVDRQNASYLRVVHASPDAPAVDIYVDNESVLTGVEFGDTSEYLTLPGGSYNVTVTVADDPDNVVFQGPVTLDPRSANTVAATGQVTEGANTTFLPVLYRDDAAEPEDENAALSVLHLSPDAPAVDVVTENGTVLADNISFRDATDYQTVPAGDYTVEIRAASDDEDGEVVATADVSLEEGTAYSALATGLLSASDNETDDAEQPFQVLVTEDATVDIELPDVEAPVDEEDEADEEDEEDDADEDDVDEEDEEDDADDEDDVDEEDEEDETDTPEEDETDTPEEDETDTPEEDETDTPEEDETDTPEEDETDTPDEDETDTPDEDETDTPEEDTPTPEVTE
jgi:hypothetical protein